jgi:hypothetical protein
LSFDPLLAAIHRLLIVVVQLPIRSQKILVRRWVKRSGMFRFAHRSIRVERALSVLEIALPQVLAVLFGVKCWREPEKRLVFALVKYSAELPVAADKFVAATLPGFVMSGPIVGLRSGLPRRVTSRAPGQR